MAFNLLTRKINQNLDDKSKIIYLTYQSKTKVRIFNQLDCIRNKKREIINMISRFLFLIIVITIPKLILN